MGLITAAKIQKNEIDYHVFVILGHDIDIDLMKQRHQDSPFQIMIVAQ
jgi:hypothetical protein